MRVGRVKNTFPMSSVGEGMDDSTFHLEEVHKRWLPPVGGRKMSSLKHGEFEMTVENPSRDIW
jgi:hypothetical protein